MKPEIAKIREIIGRVGLEFALHGLQDEAPNGIIDPRRLKLLEILYRDRYFGPFDPKKPLHVFYEDPPST